MDPVDSMDKLRGNYGLSGRGGRYGANTEICEGTNQVQRIVIARHLLG